VTRRPGHRWAALLVGAVIALTAGCRLGADDEMVPPSRTVTASPSPDTTVAPATVPVGEGTVSLADVVWAQGNVLHVGRRTVDLSPVGIDAFVVVAGGVFVLSSGELWFTDLSRLRGTGLTGVTALGVTADGTRILVTGEMSGAAAAYAYDTGTGRAVSSKGLSPLSAEERLQGPDRTGVAVPKEFELAGWAGPTTFYGVASKFGRPASVLSCGVGTRACTTLGAIEGSEPVVFGTGR
jgi:hypothetical protein